MKKILDVSKYQPNIDYATVAKNIDGVIIRCGYTGWGSANECIKDASFEKHYVGFKAAGVPVGVYYFSAADNLAKVKEEAEFCASLLKGKKFELPIYYDIEEPHRMEPLTKTALTAQVELWCDIMEKKGYFVGVYANTDYFTRKLDHARLSGKYTIWLADYRASYNKTLKRDMHQYTSTARVNGISGGVDMNNLCRDNLIEVIKSSGLNGLGAATVAPVKGLNKIVVGPMSAGDYNKIYPVVKNLADEIGNIGVEVISCE